MLVQGARAPIFRLSRKARPILPVTYSIRFSTRATSCVGSVCARPPIKSVILDQSTLSGIGNIYADEGLWEARLHFARPAIGISSRKVKELLRVCRDVMQRALEVGGTSFDALYVNVDGRSGYFARSLKAYGKHGTPCPRCNRALVRAQFQNRSSHFCPYCQRLR